MVLWDVYKETFDYLYLREAPAYLGLTLHCHFGGRPLVCAVFDKILKYFAQFPGVWFASHGEIARWTLEENIKAETHARRLLAAAPSAHDGRASPDRDVSGPTFVAPSLNSP
jgi:hypothetical protein